MSQSGPRFRWGDETGAATTEFVMVAPLLLLMLMLIVQFGLWFHAAQIANAASQEGARIARISGDPVAGEQAAQRFIADIGAGPLQVDVGGVIATYTDDLQSVRVEISGRAIPIFAFVDMALEFKVNEVSEGPIERFRPAGQEPIDR